MNPGASKAPRQQCLAGSNPAPSAILFINEKDGGYQNNVFWYLCDIKSLSQAETMCFGAASKGPHPQEGDCP